MTFDSKAAREECDDMGDYCPNTDLPCNILDGLKAARDEIGRLRKENAETGTLQDRHNAIINQQAKRIAEFEEHERQTHEILSGILGKDTSLEEGARRAMRHIAEQDVVLSQAQRVIIELQKVDARLREHIAELEGNLMIAGKRSQQTFEKFTQQKEYIAKQRAALKKLGRKYHELKRTCDRYKKVIELYEPGYLAERSAMAEIKSLEKKNKNLEAALVEERILRNGQDTANRMADAIARQQTSRRGEAMRDDFYFGRESPNWTTPEAIKFVKSLIEKSPLDDMKEFRDEWHDPALREEIDRRIIWHVEEMLAHIDAQAAQIETLQEILMNGPCERHSGKNTPPLHEFIELLQGKCILCMVEQIADLKDIAIKERAIVLDECGAPQDIENVLTGSIDELKMTAKRQLEAEYEAMK